MSKTKIFIIGIDGATWKILTPLIEKGSLPFLSSLMNKGVWGKLISTTPPNSAVAWSTFQTGVNPGKHGVFDFFKHRLNPANPPIIDADDIKAEKFWDYLGRFGKKSLLLNMPISYPPRPMNGILVTSFLTPLNKQFTYPKEVEKKLNKIGYEIDVLMEGKYGFMSDESAVSFKPKKIFNKVVQISKTRVKAFKKLTKEAEFDFFFVYFKETDFIQHIFYNGVYTQKYLHELDGIIKQAYDFYDKEIDGRKYFMVMSDHGFHPSAKIQFSPYMWLKEEFGYFKEHGELFLFWKFLNKLNIKIKESGVFLTKNKRIKRVRDEFVRKVKGQEINNLKRGKKLVATLNGIYFFHSVDYKTKKQIVAKAKKLIYKGRKVFSFVGLPDDIYKGPFTNIAPDIVWIPNEEFTIDPSPLADRLFSKKETYIKGEHISDREGILIFTGPQVVENKKVDANIEDVLPTILFLYGLPISDKIDGKVKKEFFKKGSRLARTKPRKVNEKEQVSELVKKQLEELKT